MLFSIGVVFLLIVHFCKVSSIIHDKYEILGEQYSDDNERVCGVLDTVLKGLFRVQCDDSNAGFICEYHDMKPCNSRPRPWACLQYDGVIYQVYPETKNWFSASSFCKENAGKLAVVDSRSKIRNILKIVSQSEELKYLDYFYVGIRKQSWVSQGQYSELFKMNHELWVPGFPVHDQSCSIVQTQHENMNKSVQGHLLSVHCNSVYPSVCYCKNRNGYVMPYLTTIAIQSPSQNSYWSQLFTTTSTRNSTQVERENYYLLFLLVILPLVAIVLICRLVLLKHKKGRNHLKREKDIECTEQRKPLVEKIEVYNQDCAQAFVIEKDLRSAQTKLAACYLRDFSRLSLYSQHDDDEMVPMKHLFVPMTWGRYTNRQLTELEDIESCKEMFDKILDPDQEDFVARVLIEGDAGSGKTTFIKRLAYLWSSHFYEKTTGEVEAENQKLFSYTLVIPIILRLVQTDFTLSNILHNLCDDLTSMEIAAVTNLVKSCPEKILILLDGYDEFSSRCKYINDIVAKLSAEKSTVLTTTRPYAVKQIQNLSIEGIDQILKLQGFNQDQVKQYFILFFKYYQKTQEDAKELFEYLRTVRPDLLRLAKTPIRSEMISIVWNAYGRLGETIADLYLLFVTHLLQHFEKKKKSGITNDKQLLYMYSKTLGRLGSMANTRTNSGRLLIVFSTAKLERELGKDGLFDILHIGLLAKSHPASHMHKALWSFPHLSIQEFMIAFYLNTATDAEVDKFTSQCQNLKTLERSEVIFQYLVSKYPAVSNKILTKIIRSATSISDCKILVQFLLKLFPHFHRDMHIPMPRYLQTEWGESEDSYKAFNRWMSMDKSENFQNMESLNIHSYKGYQYCLGQNYLKNLELTVENKHLNDINTASLKEMKSLGNFSLEVETETSEVQDVSGLNDILRCLVDKKIEHLVVQSNINTETANIIVQYVNLQELFAELHVDHLKIKDKLESHKTLKKANFTSACEADLFTMKTANVELKLEHVTQEQLSKTVARIKQPNAKSNVTSLDISGNNLKDYGALLGEVMLYLKSLTSLDLSACDINKNTVKQINNNINGRETKLETLNLKHNNLKDSGHDLGVMLNLMPLLKLLCLLNCKLKSSDLAEMAEAVPANANIKKLNLYRNNLGNATEGGSKFLLKLKQLEALKIGGPGFIDPVPCVCESLENGALSELYLLDLFNNKLHPGSVKMLGDHLYKMEKLQVLSLQKVKDVKKEEYSSVFENISPQTKHLNIYSAYVKPTAIQILEYKDNLIHLDRLNINLDEDDVEMLQEEFEEKNPEMVVYSDLHESVWE